jgi:hypothetical protein
MSLLFGKTFLRKVTQIYELGQYALKAAGFDKVKNKKPENSTICGLLICFEMDF